mmetsp:Transcript_42185/g.78461  ORF Transcript_42185/g.78461 Transcript_42185/m.78461 type:complete len:242 (+) Transcript_42185:64-789(+)
MSQAGAFCSLYASSLYTSCTPLPPEELAHNQMEMMQDGSAFCHLCRKYPVGDQIRAHITSNEHVRRMRYSDDRNDPLEKFCEEERQFIFENRNGVAYCRACGKNADEAHLWSDGHKRRAKWALDRVRLTLPGWHHEAPLPADMSVMTSFGPPEVEQRADDQRVEVAASERPLSPPPPQDPPPERLLDSETRQAELKSFQATFAFPPEHEEQHQVWLQEVAQAACAWLHEDPDMWLGDEMSF